MNWLFRGKKVISRLFLTLTFLWLLLGAAILFPGTTPWLPGGVLLVLALGGTVGQVIVSRLSRTCPQFTADRLPDSRYLVAVAGSGFQRHSHRVPESWFGDNFIIRLTEASRVAGILQNASVDFQLCVSMPEHPALHAEKLLGLQAFFSRFGIQPDRIQIIDTALDSEDEMEAFEQYGLPVIIVSNSWHVPRLMLFACYRQQPALPAPAGQLFHMPRMRGFSGLLPSAGNLQLLECALHELAGILQAFCKYRLLRRNLSPK
ncbi:MAG: hypothetical protein BWY31_04306 [Lentisphaerae bacterium ADurb.Bin242]|nr:MAG: hypothetical protein BWY31_04306 [Lentisphaerae bacterium ADurb.Bin242]